MTSSSHVMVSPRLESQKSAGHIQVIFGPMFSGKTTRAASNRDAACKIPTATVLHTVDWMFLDYATVKQAIQLFVEFITELIRRLKRFQIANYKCLIIKYAKDDRYAKEGIATHDRNTLPAIPAEKLNDLKHEAEQYDVIGIDEGQFFPDVVPFSDQMADRGKIVIVAALDGTFQRKGFGDILQLVPIAESVIKLSAVCMKCNNEGHFTRRKTQETSVEVIGGTDKYLAVCRACFQSPIKKSPTKSNSTPSMKPIQSDKANRKLFTHPTMS